MQWVLLLGILLLLKEAHYWGQRVMVVGDVGERVVWGGGVYSCRAAGQPGTGSAGLECDQIVTSM